MVVVPQPKSSFLPHGLSQAKLPLGKGMRGLQTVFLRNSMLPISQSEASTALLLVLWK